MRRLITAFSVRLQVSVVKSGGESPHAKMSTLLRPTIPADVPKILSLIDGIFREYNCKLDATNEDVHLLAPGPYFRERGGEFWVVDDDGSILATVAVLLHNDAGELKALYVHPSLRRHGWGRKLTQLTIDFVRSAAKPRMILWSDTRFTDAHRLYRKMGFSQFGKRDLYDSNNSIEYGFEMLLV